jgi:hypothetical protein
MTTIILKTGLQPTPETSTMDNVQHNIRVIYHPLSQNWRGSGFIQVDFFWVVGKGKVVPVLYLSTTP